MWCLFDFNIFDVYAPQMPKNKDLKQKAYENLIYGYKRVDILLITIPSFLYFFSNSGVRIFFSKFLGNETICDC